MNFYSHMLPFLFYAKQLAHTFKKAGMINLHLICQVLNAKHFFLGLTRSHCKKEEFPNTHNTTYPPNSTEAWKISDVFVACS